jgi:hypothetical protein
MIIIFSFRDLDMFAEYLSEKKSQPPFLTFLPTARKYPPTSFTGESFFPAMPDTSTTCCLSKFTYIKAAVGVLAAKKALIPI